MLIRAHMCASQTNYKPSESVDSAIHPSSHSNLVSTIASKHNLRSCVLSFRHFDIDFAVRFKPPCSALVPYSPHHVIIPSPTSFCSVPLSLRFLFISLIFSSSSFPRLRLFLIQVNSIMHALWSRPGTSGKLNPQK